MLNCGSDDSVCAPLPMSGTQLRNSCDCQTYSEDELGPFTNRWVYSYMSMISIVMVGCSFDNLVQLLPSLLDLFH